MIGSIMDWIERMPLEHSRFPGWEIRARYDPMGTLMLAAKRKSDGKTLFYRENCDSSIRDAQRAMGVMADKLGAEFLDLVPLAQYPQPKGGNSLSKPEGTPGVDTSSPTNSPKE